MRARNMGGGFYYHFFWFWKWELLPILGFLPIVKSFEPSESFMVPFLSSREWRAPLLVRFVAHFLFFTFWKGSRISFATLSFMRRRAPLCNFRPTEGIEIFLEPTNEFAIGFSTLWVIGWYFSCNFMFLSFSYFFLFHPSELKT